MRNLMLFLFFSVTFSYNIFGFNNQNSSSGFAKIRFVDNNANHSKTYLGILSKGDLQSLKYELQNGYTEEPTSLKDRNKAETEGYVNRVTAKSHRKKWKSNRKKAKNDLIGNYEVTDEESLLEVKEKKLEQREKRISNKDITGNYKSYAESMNTRQPNSYLSKHYRISGRRIHNGQTVKKRAGYVCLILKYKIREGSYVNTYINIVEDYLKEGSNYNLKYHGNGSNRKYYLEYVSSTSK